MKICQVGRLKVVGDSELATVQMLGAFALVDTTVMSCDNDLADKAKVKAQPDAFQRAMDWAKEHQDAMEPWRLKHGAQ